MNEKQVLTSLKEGDEKAFDVIFHKYASNLYYFSLDMLKNEAEAEEVVQDAFLVVWENRKIIDTELNFRNYLNSIAKHKIYNIFRRRVSAKRFEQSGRHLDADALSVEVGLQLDDLRKLLQKSIVRLATYQKEILVLKSQDLTNDEIAEMLVISKKTVEYHLTKAYKQLRIDLHFLKDSLFMTLPLINSTL